MPTKRICLPAIVALSVFTVTAFAAPPWCPDLTGNNFVNFPDFAVQANYWRQTGSGLPGDFVNYGAVDINDFAYLALWWLHDCYDPPIDFCPDCIYPDCNLMDCNDQSLNPCYLCDSTPKFLMVTISGSHGCGCACLPDHQGSTYTDPTYSIDGNYIVPYGPGPGGFYECEWSGIYNHSIIKIESHYPGDCCAEPTDPDDIANRYDKVLIRVIKFEPSTIYVYVYLWNIYFQKWDSIMSIDPVISNPTNCVEGSGNIIDCTEYDTNTSIGSGNITITLLP